MKEEDSVEARIYQYICEHGLQEGDVLPEDDTLAKLIGCSVEEVAETLVVAEEECGVERHASGKTVVLKGCDMHNGGAFSFTTSARNSGEKLETQLVSAEVRMPVKEDVYDADSMLVEMERRAHRALELGAEDPFIVIVRLRVLNSMPKVIHRAYLRPENFPHSFLEDHNFAEESLIALYERYGYEPTSRNTTLHARIAHEFEGELGVRLGKPVLVAEQELFAVEAKTGDSLVLEYMQATYVDLDYVIKNRPAS